MISLDKDFTELCTINNLYRAYLKCRQGKRKSVNTRDFEANLYRELCLLSHKLRSESYQPSRSVCFYVTKPKLREIFAAHFRDRVVHRLVVDLLEPQYEKKFITDSFACRTGKGTHRAVLRTREFLRKGTGNGHTPYYYLQLDIKGFFMQMHKPTLMRILAREIREPGLLAVLRTIVHHNPADHFVYRGKIPPGGKLPPHKTLFHEDRERGIPIGNLTSQFFANIYLNELDQFVKRRLGVKHYLRYVDDFILLHRDPQQLLNWQKQIIGYLKEHLRLTLKDEAVGPVSVYKGIDFLGYFIKPRYVLIRRRVFRNYKRALAEVLPPPADTRGKFERIVYPPSEVALRKCQSRINSYIAHFRYGNTERALLDLDHKIRSLQSVIRLENNFLRIPRILSRFYRFLNQIAYFQKQFPRHLLVLPVGRFFEIYGDGADELAAHLNLAPYYRSGMKTYGIKRWFGRKPDFRRVKVTDLLRLAQKYYIPYVLFRHDLMETERVKQRLPFYSMTLTGPVQLELNF